MHPPLLLSQLGLYTILSLPIWLLKLSQYARTYEGLNSRYVRRDTLMRHLFNGQLNIQINKQTHLPISAQLASLLEPEYA